jgi:hypothetical protein
MKKITKYTCLILLVMISILPVSQDSFSQVKERVKEFSGKNVGTSYARQLSKHFKKHRLQALDLKEISTFVATRQQKSQFALNIADERFMVEVEPVDMRAEGFKAIAMTDKGPIELVQTVSNTYKGFANGDKSNTVRLNISDSIFEGYIKIRNRWLYIDKLNHFVPEESNDKVVVYNADDVIPDATKKCGAEIVNDGKAMLNAQSNFSAASVTCHFLEVATEADFEYFQAFGSNAAAALNRIRNILNLVEGLYTSAFNVKFILRYQQIWTVAADPYTGNTLAPVFQQFIDFWNAHNSSIVRDITQMYSGRSVVDSIAGWARKGTVCNSTNYYSIVRNFSPVTNSTIGLSAHEIGHNFGADHDLLCNGRNIMCSNIQSGIPEWSTLSVALISAYIARSGSCLNEFFPIGFTIIGNGIPTAFLKRVASQDLTINTTIGAVMLNSSGFGHLEAGRSIVLTPTNPNSLAFVAPEGSTLLMRISDFVNTCDPLTSVITSIPNKSLPQHTGQETNNNIEISPNPFNSNFELRFNLKKNEKARVIIYNTAGKKVKELSDKNLSDGFNKLAIDGSDLAAGVYLVEIYLGATKTVKKIVKL